MKNLKNKIFLFIFITLVLSTTIVFASDNVYDIKKDVSFNEDGSVNVFWDPSREAMVISGSGQMSFPGRAIESIFRDIGSELYDRSEDDTNPDKDKYKKELEKFYNAIIPDPESGADPTFKLIIEEGVSFPDEAFGLFSVGPIYYREIIFPKNLDTSNVTYMTSMFQDQKYLNPDVSNWDTSNVKSIESMFARATIANPDVSRWNTSSMTNMAGAFQSTERANPNVSNWDTSNVTLMHGMFMFAKVANPDVSKWNVKKVEQLSYMFYGAENASPDVSNWKPNTNGYMMMFWNSGVKELDMRKWIVPGNSYDLSNFMDDTPKLQYVYLPSEHDVGSTEFTNVMSEDFKMQKYGEKSGPIMPGSQSSFTFTQTGTPTVYFVPQNIMVETNWVDNNDYNKVRPAKKEITLLANAKEISDNIKKPDTNPIEINPSNSWSGDFKDLDIFSLGSKIKYSLKQDPIEDYITDYEYYKPMGLSEKEALKTNGIRIVNTYMDIVEEKEFGIKPRCPHNFVRVVVDTTDKASEKTKFKRAFWVTPNKEITLPVNDPIGQEGKWEFANWKEKDSETIWQKGQPIKKQFKKDTNYIFAEYKEIIKEQYWSFTSSDYKKDIKTHEAYLFGYPDKTLRPDGNITRAEATSLVLRLEGLHSKDANFIFKDCAKNAWYNKDINLAFEKGMLDALDNKIRPDDMITRGEFAKLIGAIDKKIYKETPFLDIKNHKYEKEISKAYANGRIQGYPDKTFKPDGEITRAEVVVILNKLYNRSADKDYVDRNYKILNYYKDLNKNHWAYYDLVEAANSHKYYRSSQNSSEEIWQELVK